MEEPWGKCTLLSNCSLRTLGTSLWAPPFLSTLCAFKTRRNVTSSLRGTNSWGWVTARVCQPSPRDPISDILRFSSDLGAYFQSASKSRKASTLRLHILQQSKSSNRSWKLQRQLLLRVKDWTRRTQTSWTQFTALLQAACQGWDMSVKCCGPVPQLHNRVISSFLPRTFCLTQSQSESQQRWSCHESSSAWACLNGLPRGLHMWMEEPSPESSGWRVEAYVPWESTWKPPKN